jgi:cellulose synthase/poly-beta-1,6-N-acetylglucosamine synthase-like glycosyltransferase
VILVVIVFWTCAAGVLYTYFGYPLLLGTLAGLKQWRSDWQFVSNAAARRASAVTSAALPRVAVIVAAFNEERDIEARVRNLLAQDYPADRLSILIGSDGSTDRTAEIVRALAHPSVRFIDFAARRGKASVLNDLVAMADEEVLVFTDANTTFQHDAVRMLMRRLDDPGVGCVCGELRLVRAGDTGDNQDHVYWRYERMLKFHESRIGGLLGANGGVYALRRRDYVPVPANTIVDDFWISMQVVERGLRCVYDPEAIATEAVPENISDEFGRRIRIGTGNYQSLVRFAGLLVPRRGVAVAFTFLSHKVLRWLAPHMMILALACSATLATRPFYAAMLAAQAIFYALSWAGWKMARTGRTPAILRLPLFFTSMNVGLLVGFWRFSKGAASGTWTRTAR